MVTALNHPTMVDRLLVLDVAPVSGVSTTMSDVQSHITALKSLDCSTVRDRRQADEQLRRHITVRIIIFSLLFKICTFLFSRKIVYVSFY